MPPEIVPLKNCKVLPVHVADFDSAWCFKDESFIQLNTAKNKRACMESILIPQVIMIECKGHCMSYMYTDSNV